MKTALRSYHPVPSLQKTDGNLQDAPRIKNCLKAALLPSEFKGTPPSSPLEILEKAVGSQVADHPSQALINVTLTARRANPPNERSQPYIRACQLQQLSGKAPVIAPGHKTVANR